MLPLILRQAWAALDLRQEDPSAQLHRLCESINVEIIRVPEAVNFPHGAACFQPPL